MARVRCCEAEEDEKEHRRAWRRAWSCRIPRGPHWMVGMAQQTFSSEKEGEREEEGGREGQVEEKRSVSSVLSAWKSTTLRYS